jgi:hypothetical protein
LYIRARKLRALDYDALEVGGCNCFARVQHAVSLGDADADAIEVSGTADINQIRVIEIQRAESNDGYALHLASATANAVCNLHCQSVYAVAAVPMRCDSAAHYTRLGHISTASSNLQTLQLVAGRLIADQIEQYSAGSVVEVSFPARLFAQLVINTFANVNGIKVLNTLEDSEAIVDVGEIKLQSTGEYYSVFADNKEPTPFAMIRNFRSTLPISSQSPPLPDNHP